MSQRDDQHDKRSVGRYSCGRPLATGVGVDPQDAGQSHRDQAHPRRSPGTSPPRWATRHERRHEQRTEHTEGTGSLMPGAAR